MGHWDSLPPALWSAACSPSQTRRHLVLGVCLIPLFSGLAKCRVITVTIGTTFGIKEYLVVTWRADVWDVPRLCIDLWFPVTSSLCNCRPHVGSLLTYCIFYLVSPFVSGLWWEKTGDILNIKVPQHSACESKRKSRSGKRSGILCKDPSIALPKINPLIASVHFLFLEGKAS